MPAVAGDGRGVRLGAGRARRSASALHLYRAASHAGEGEFSDVAYVQRLNAVSREPGTACAASSVGRAAREPFSADFLFYKAP